MLKYGKCFSHLLLSLGEGASIIEEPLGTTILPNFLHNSSPDIRLSAALCLRCLVTALPSQLAAILQNCVTTIKKGIEKNETNTGKNTIGKQVKVFYYFFSVFEFWLTGTCFFFSELYRNWRECLCNCCINSFYSFHFIGSSKYRYGFCVGNSNDTFEEYSHSWFFFFLFFFWFKFLNFLFF